MRNLLAFITGMLIGSAVNMTIVTVGPMVIPLPPGVDMTDMNRFAENLALLQPANFIPPWLAHALGALTGAFLAARIATSHRMKLALAVSALFLIGGVIMVVQYGGPMWFITLDLVGAYLPMGYLGGALAGARHPA
jgi:hypothetical protein